MLSRAPVLFSWFVLAGIGPGTAAAQRAVAKSGLNVRSGQSTGSQVVDHLAAGDTVKLLSPGPRLGYLHVRSAGGVQGWAWAARLQIIPGGTVPSGVPRASRAATPTAPATSATSPSGSPTIDPSWPRIPSNSGSYTWTDAPHSVCPATGAGGDGETNRWKNRTDSAAAYHEVSWGALANLPFPHNRKKHRADWPAGDLASIAGFEGIPISAVGFLSGIRVEIPGKKNGVPQKGETTNCGENSAPRVDWHMYFTRSPHEAHYLGVVLETTPRVRPLHPGWDTTKVKQVVAAGDTIRVSGWLMFDPEHWDQMLGYVPGDTATKGKARITLWEIHPVTRLELRRGGRWVLLDDLP
jgi:hypothetical protein